MDMAGGPRRGSDSRDLMYLSGQAIHTFLGTQPQDRADLQKDRGQLVARGGWSRAGRQSTVVDSLLTAPL